MSPGPGTGAARGRDGGRRLRVLEVCGSAAGGVRSHVLECARLLAADRHDVILLAFLWLNRTNTAENVL